MNEVLSAVTRHVDSVVLARCPRKHVTGIEKEFQTDRDCWFVFLTKEVNKGSFFFGKFDAA
jgi:hypothetical protein